VPSTFAQATLNPASRIRLSWARQRIFPGDILRIDIKTGCEVRELSLSFADQNVSAHRGTAGGAWRVLLGIDLDTKPGTYVLKGKAILANSQSVNLEKRLRILPKKFPVQRITVEEKYVTLDPSDAKRADEESQKLQTLWRTVTPEKFWQGTFLAPVQTNLTSGFGRRRVVNNQPRSPHSGVDLKAQTGTPILAANSGKVVLAEDLFFSGNTVVLDHGLGLYTFYAHCSDILVKMGDVVKTGQFIAKVGATGRVTGPHLHWACRLNQARVNPLDLTRSSMVE
jgi:murein DD-endopeptidase MepM/ murein hydrolase activator NlpD